MDGIRKTQGFALMLVISMLTIVSSLIIGFALLSNLDNKKIANTFHSPALVAKQNALRALNEALAKLQAASGQDTVATAKADILGTAENKHWVGVWKVNKCDEKVVTEQDQKNFLIWLVSGDYYEESDCQTAIETTRRIAIIDPKYTNITPVYVELVDTADSNSSGQYAYWIDDQSLKIQGNIYDFGNSFKELFIASSRSNNDAYNLAKKQCQGKYGLAMVADYGNCPLTQEFLDGHKDIQSEVSYTNLLDLSAISDVQQQYLQNKFHDLTNLSLGLLTDTRNGGFRKNLRYSTNYLSEVPNNAFIFLPPETNFPAPPTTWGYLKSFVEINTGSLVPRATTPLYRPQAGVNYSDCTMTTTTDANGYTTGVISGTNSGDLGIATVHGIYPIWVEFKNYAILYYFSGYTPTNGSGGGHYQSLRMQPGFYFENPYTYALNSTTIKIGQWAPYVSNPENGDTARYQKQPTFRCRIFHVDESSIDGLLQGYSNSENDDDRVFPFLSIAPDKYMRPVWDGTITMNCARASAKYIYLNTHTSYIASGKVKTLATTTNNNLNGYNVNDIRFYQDGINANTMADKCLIESYPSSSSSDWNGTWFNDTDQWTSLCLRIMDNNGNVLQQICDIEMKYNSLNSDRNFTSNNLASWYGKYIPLYLTCVSLRQEPSPTSNYWHQYTPNGIGVRPLIEANPCAPISCRTAHQDDMISPSYSNNFIPGNWSWCAHWLGLSDANSTTCNHSEHVPFTEHSEFRNLFDLPEPTYKFFNLGFLQHMNAGCFSYHPTYAFGNSYQNPHIPRDRFFQQSGSISGSTWPSHNRVEMLYDYSYCLNRTLWDGYFIAATDSDTTNPVLINHRQKVFTGIDTLAIKNSIYSFQNAAENMAIHGAFNINSTSKDAWTAFLGSTAGNFTNNETYAEYSRIQTLNSTSDVGLCQLNQTQVQSLAEKVVEQIKLRGVAGSIGEFVNRKLIAKNSDTTHKLGLKGALQAAIDGTNINSTSGGTIVTSNRDKAWFDDEAASGPFWACKPGYLTQADILQSTATTLCARGDTFCIYAYGNALDANGNIEAETRCEAIVQRLPELIDPSKPELGRKYKILAMKWITSLLTINSQLNSLYSNYFSHITDAFNRKETARSIGDRAWGESGCDQYWAIGNMAEKINEILLNFSNNSNLEYLSFELEYHLWEKENRYSERFSDPVTGALNTATWNAYRMLYDFTQGNASKADVRQAVNDAYAEIDAFLASSPSNQQEFQDAVNSLNATAESAGTVDNSTSYTHGYQGSTHTNGAQAAGSILGLEAIKDILSLYTSH
ncbi:MAG: hypothetical protein LBF34_02595 [Puniceicoccales bacterium]|jgi:hypothetical protein|nr:hypothetical protein [Puniceicoccales bacterium]